MPKRERITFPAAWHNVPGESPNADAEIVFAFLAIPLISDENRHEARRNASIWRSQAWIWFQLTGIWSTILRSPPASFGSVTPASV